MEGSEHCHPSGDGLQAWLRVSLSVLLFKSFFYRLYLCFSILVAESYGGGKISFVADQGVSVEGKTEPQKTINSAVWEPLEKLSKGEGWPRSDLYTKKKYEELVEEHKAWPDRVATLKDAYARKMKEGEEKEAAVKSEL